MAQQATNWFQDLQAAREMFDLAQAYLDDGAYRTAADRMGEAAALLRSAAEKRPAPTGKRNH